MTAAIDITTEQRKMLLELLRRFIPGVAVWAYGSRVKWTARPNSDLDLVAFTTPEQHSLVSELKEALAESNLPFLVDFHVWDEVPERFHEIIRKEYVVLQEAKQPERDSVMAGEWKRASLREAGVTLIDCDHRTPSAADSGFPYIAIPQLKEGRLDLSEVRRISPEHFSDWTRKAKPQHYDVILSRRCNPGETAYVPAGLECALGQNLVLLRSDAKKVFPPFLRWLVRGPDWWAQVGAFINVGAVFDSLKCADIPNFKMPLPPLPKQKAIAHILGTLDDKIELNRRTNATLEAMARALFQSWFVDFDPVRAKLDGRQPAGLDVATAALFPAHFQDSPLGHIPQGWQVKPMSEVIEVNPRRTLKSGAISPYLDMKNMPTQGHAADEVIHREFSSGTKFQNGDTLLARITPCLENGKSAFVDFLEDGQIGWGSTEYIVFAPKPPLTPEFGYYLARSDALRLHAIQNMTGTSGRQRVPSDCFTQFQLAVPPTEIAQHFGEITKPWMAMIHANIEQSRTLATLRDTLLPKLLSGELSVANVEEEVDSV